jgi:hypothetical protein
MADKKAKEMKSLVEAILQKKEISYEDWLYQKHLEFLAENSETVLNALKQVNQ